MCVCVSVKRGSSQASAHLYGLLKDHLREKQTHEHRITAGLWKIPYAINLFLYCKDRMVSVIPRER